MKRLWLFSMTAGLLLSSASLPPLPTIEPVDVSDRAAAEPSPVELAALIEAEPVLDYGPVLAGAAPDVPQEPVDEGAAPEPAPAPAPLPERAPNGVRVVVSIPLQKAYVFADGDLVATSPVSTGKRGHQTPAGTFRILQKKVHHHSSKYDNAPMPYMQRLTNYGIALHAGALPGYPASHGCIRLPRSFAKKLFGLTDHGTKVTITHRRPKSAEDALDLA
jgi:lipoprotein-anchoring transpeptidase ErfK/SrfK